MFDYQVIRKDKNPSVTVILCGNLVNMGEFDSKKYSLCDILDYETKKANGDIQIDMRDVSKIDITGISTIFNICNFINSKFEKQLCLLGVNESIKQVLLKTFNQGLFFQDN